MEVWEYGILVFSFLRQSCVALAVLEFLVYQTGLEFRDPPASASRATPGRSTGYDVSPYSILHLLCVCCHAPLSCLMLLSQSFHLGEPASVELTASSPRNQLVDLLYVWFSLFQLHYLSCLFTQNYTFSPQDCLQCVPRSCCIFI